MPGGAGPFRFRSSLPEPAVHSARVPDLERRPSVYERPALSTSRPTMGRVAIATATHDELRQIAPRVPQP